MPGHHAQSAAARYLTPGVCHPSVARGYEPESGDCPDIASVLEVEWSHSPAPETPGDPGEGAFMLPRGMRKI